MSLFDILLGTDYLKDAVWKKGREMPFEDSSVWRLDDFDNKINYFSYGNRNCQFGWEKDHYPIPKSQGGSDTIDNLRPLHWKANAGLGGLLGK